MVRFRAFHKSCPRALFPPDTRLTAASTVGCPGLVLVMAAAGLWATVGVATRMVPEADVIPDEVFALARLAIGAPVVLLAAQFSRGTEQARPSPLSWVDIGCFALTSAIFQLCLFSCFTLLGVTVTVFITVCLPPVIALVCSIARRSSELTAPVIVSLGLALAGLAAFALSSGGLETTGTSVPGLILAVVASAVFVAMSHAARRMARATSALNAAGRGLLSSALILALAVPLFLQSDIAEVAMAVCDWHVILLLAYLGAGPTALAYIFYCTGMAQCRSAVSGLIASMVEPALAAILASLVLHESLNQGEITGSAMLLIAMTLLWWSERREVRVRVEPLRA